MAIPMPGPYETPQIIQGILQRRREESRQAMLDKLQEERVRADMSADAQRLAQGQQQLDISRGQLGVQQEAESRAALMDESQRREIAERTLASQISTMGDVEQEITPEWKASNPDLYGELVKRQRIRRDVLTPKVGTSYETQLPEGSTPEQIEEFARSQEMTGSADLQTAGPQERREVFTGSPEFQRTRYTQDQLRSLAQDPNITPELRRQLLLQAGGAQNVDGRLLSERVARPISHTGQWGQTQNIGPYDDVVNLPQPYQYPAALQPKEYQELDPQGRPIRTHFITPEQGRLLADQLSQRNHTLVETSAPFAPTQGLERAKDVAASAYANAWTSTAPRAQRNAELNQHRTNLISNTVVSDPAIKQTLHSVSERILAMVESDGRVSFNAGEALTQYVRGRHPNMSANDIAEITDTIQKLLTNVPKAEPPATPRSAAPIRQLPGD